MWFSTILLHRPFIAHWQLSHEASNQQQSTIDPFEICVYAANNICSVLNKYSNLLQDLPCDLVFCIFMAAMIHLRRYRQAGPDASHAQHCLQQCTQWLTMLGKQWKSAEVRHQLLQESELPNFHTFNDYTMSDMFVKLLRVLRIPLQITLARQHQGRKRICR